MQDIQLPCGVTVRGISLSSPSNLMAEGQFAVLGDNAKNAELRQWWQKLTAKQFQLADPAFRLLNKKHLFKRSNLKHVPEQTNIWSGGIVFPTAGDRMNSIWGTWTVPQPTLPAGAQSDIWYSASTWIGIDGDDGSGDVLQAGCDSDIILTNSVPRTQITPWWEWYPAGTFQITSINASAGDVFTCMISVTVGSTTSASIFLLNNTTGVGSFFNATAPTGTSLQGNCAEWIVEALQINTAMPELAKFNVVSFSDCNAGTLGGKTIQSGSGTTIDMVDGTNKVISTGKLIGPAQVQVQYAGP